MLIFQEVSKEYPNDVTALKDVSFRIKEGEFVSLVGRSGAGKSTILKMILREAHPTSGSVFFQGVDISTFRHSELPLYRRKVASVFQDFKLLSSKTVFENVAFAMEAAGQPNKEIKEDVPQALEVVGLTGKEKRFPHELSGGEKQRVAMARALVQRPEVLAADEPTGNLDPIHTWEITDLLLKINKLGTAVILATHDEAVINALKKRVITLHDGKIVSDEEKGKYKIK
ncbi:MAG: cell division ATP-binding protein FtsE [Candidatus Spechtbacterales bacterium]|nr:cell division ATP-binding protein FtsE [Candidatus Spechtbacterales bacterium]